MGGELKNKHMKAFIAGLLFFLCVDVQAQELKRWKTNDLLQYIAKSDSALVVNFWATFCGPCIEEIPYFQDISKQYASKKVKLLLVSLDFKEYYPEKIASFATKYGFTAEIVWLDEEKPDEFCPLIDKSWSGAMPATLFSNKTTGRRKFIEAQLNRERFEGELIHLTGLECPTVLPAYKGWVNDFEDVFSKEEEKKIESAAGKINNGNTAQIAVVTVSDINPFDSFSKYAFYLGNCWGVGDKEKQNGIVILFSASKRKIWIANGYGIEHKLTDANTKKIIDEVMLPLFKKKLYLKGTLDGINAIAAKLKIKKG
jgi:thiol-disulfide isomerase/thioredoxin